MPRLQRPHLPGAIFHLTARTLRRERRFTPRLRGAALRAIADVAPRSGARILAVAIMSNHLHIVAQQGDRPLSALMQPLLRRLARLLQTAHGLDGPMFWRPYASEPCLDPRHARNAIVYTHLNPVRAGICADPAEYRWTTHSLYLRDHGDPVPPALYGLAHVLDPALALPLFAATGLPTRAELRDHYRDFVAWRIACDRAAARAGDDDAGADRARTNRSEQPVWKRDEYGPNALSPLFHSPVRRREGGTVGPAPLRHLPDPLELARATLASELPGWTLEDIRGRRGGAVAARLRGAVIRRLHAAGFPNTTAARILGLSQSGVSRVVRAGPLG